MDTHLQQKSMERNHNEESSANKQPPLISPASPPSQSSSPSHEFSFTISLHSSSNTIPEKTKTSSSIAVDLSPADDIFFHGHLLPLHLLSHLPISPRLSTNSLDKFTLPVTDDPKPEKISKSDSNIRTNMNNSIQGKTRPKSKSFSIFRWQKGRTEETEKQNNNKKKVGFDLRHVLKRYVRMIRPLLLFRRRKEKQIHQHHRQAYSFSGNLSLRNKGDLVRGRRAEYYSAPASMRTSPSNSGLLVATTGFASSTSDSTMEELQAAIQAAIAHCKNSIGADDKVKS